MMKARQSQKTHRIAHRKRDLKFFFFFFYFFFVFILLHIIIIIFGSYVFIWSSKCWNMSLQCFPIPLQMYRTVKTTDKPAASSGNNSYCLAFTFFSFSSLIIFFLLPCLVLFLFYLFIYFFTEPHLENSPFVILHPFLPTLLNL